MKKGCRGGYYPPVMRKVLSLFVALAMLCALVPCFAATEQYGDLYYSVNEDNTVTITDCDEAATSVDIPSEINDLLVTDIGRNAFSSCKSLTDVTIPSSVTYIGDRAFEGCDSLTSITIPDSVTKIYNYAFSGCDNLTSVTIGNGVTLIGNNVFWCCNSLTSINVDDNNPNYCSVDGNLFNKDKTELIQYATGKTDETYIIPDGVMTIGNAAFMNCGSLGNVTIPDSVTEISSAAFADTGYSNDESNWENGVLYIDNCLIEAAPYDIPDEYEIKSGTRLISESAFGWCDSLTKVIIPDGVKSIGEYAFEGCESLTSITIPSSVTSIGKYAFEDTAYYSNGINWNSGVLYIDNCLIAAKSYNIPTEYEIKSGTLLIADNAFEYCEGLINITIPDSVKDIGSYAFFGCSNLTSATISGSVTSIGDSAFFGCSKLTSTTIPGSITSIGNRAFYNCSKLTNVEIPSGVTLIGEQAFSICYSLTSINVDNNNPNYCSVDGNLFNKDKTELMQYAIGKTDKTYIIPDNITMISEGAFWGCRKLTSIIVDSNNPNYCSVDGNLFNKNKTKLIQYAIGKTNETYIIPSGVKTIGEQAFFYCLNLANVVIPNSVTMIDEAAFDGCNNLTDVYYGGSELEWVLIGISSRNDNLTGATIHYNSTGPIAEPTATPTIVPTTEPTTTPTTESTTEPTTAPTIEPTTASTTAPTIESTAAPTTEPTATSKPTEPTTYQFNLSYSDGSVAITSDGEEIPEGSVLIAAQYSGGALTRVKTYAAGENVDISSDFDPSAAVKLMLWNSVEGMKPFAAAVEAAADEASPFEEMDSSGSGPMSMVVSDVLERQDLDGNTVYEIKGYSGGAEVKVTTNQNTVAGNLTESIWSASDNGKNYDADIIWKAADGEGSIENAVGAGDIILYTLDGKLIARYANPQNVYAIAHDGEGTLPNTIGSRPNKLPSRCQYYFNKIVSAELNDMAVVKIEDCDHDIVFDPSMPIDVVTISSSGVTVQKEADTITEIQNGDYLWVSLIDKGQTIGDMYIYRIAD